MNGPAGQQRPLWKVLLLDIYWLNLFNPRMWFASFWTAFLGVAALAMLRVPEQVTTPVFVVLFFASLLATCLVPARCTRCRARIRVGATTCKAGHPIGSAP